MTTCEEVADSPMESLNATISKSLLDREEAERNAVNECLARAEEERAKFFQKKAQQLSKRREQNRAAEQALLERLEQSSGVEDERVWERVSELISEENGTSHLQATKLAMVDLVSSKKKNDSDDEAEALTLTASKRSKKSKRMTKSDLSRMSCLIEDLKKNPPVHIVPSSLPRNHSDMSF